MWLFWFLGYFAAGTLIGGAIALYWLRKFLSKESLIAKERQQAQMVENVIIFCNLEIYYSPDRLLKATKHLVYCNHVL